MSSSDKRIVWLTAIGIAFLIALGAVWMWGRPQYNLWRAGIELQIQIKDAESKAVAAKSLATAEVNRAVGVAKANEIIAGSITPAYLRYFYIQQLSAVEANGGRIIYVPTEAGLPILEAGRATQGGTP